jgi:hypothetical protein
MEIQGSQVDPVQHMPMVLINPSLTFDEKTEVGPEGCLISLIFFADIKRSATIGVKALDLSAQKSTFDVEDCCPGPSSMNAITCGDTLHRPDGLCRSGEQRRKPASVEILTKERLKR